MPKSPKLSTPFTAPKQGNYVSEWFGYRTFPIVSSAPNMIAVQGKQHCPFLSASTGETRTCVKAEASKGVCTINSVSGEKREEWLVCPYRAVGEDILAPAIRRLFSINMSQEIYIASAPSLEKMDVRHSIDGALTFGKRVFVFFQDKLGGEISLPRTEHSPELSFDITLVEILRTGESYKVGTYGILEVQTMDFHGTYKHAVKNLTDALRLHKKEFPQELATHRNWLSDHVEGPNLANVFKRTFYQMVFKFQMGLDKDCVGCVLAVSASVWASWQRHLGKPNLEPNASGTFSLKKPIFASPPPLGDEIPRSDHLETNQPTGELSAPAWIYVFEISANPDISPSRIEISKVIETDAHSFSYFALDVAPAAAVASAADSIKISVLRKMSKIWPVFAS